MTKAEIIMKYSISPNIIPTNITGRLIILIFFLFGPLPAIALYLENNFTFFYQAFAPESVLWACGHGLYHPQEIIAPLYKFLTGEVREFNCTELGSSVLGGPSALFSRVQPYFTWSAAILWRLFGISYLSLLPLVFVLYGMYSAGTYALSRLFLDKKYAVVSASILSIAPVTVGMVLYLRDFSKAPFFVWSFFFLIKAIREYNLQLRILYATLSALIIGVGFGFRSDLLVMLPIGTIVLSLASKTSHGPPFFLSFSRFLTPSVFVIVGLVAASPVWTQIKVTSVGGTYAMQGATEHFRLLSGLQPAGYAVGWKYSDELTLSGVASSQRRIDPDWDAKESAGKKFYGVSRAITQSTAYLLGWADLFAADFLAQAVKSAGWILGLPAFWARVDAQHMYMRTDLLGPLSPVRLSLSAYNALGQSWFVYFGALGAITFFFKIYARSRREALCLFLLFGFLLTYPGLQFDPRHVFHLEFIWIISSLTLLTTIPCIVKSWRIFPRFAAYLLGFSAIASIIFITVIQYQKWSLSGEIAKLLTLPRQQIPSHFVLQENGDHFFQVSIPEMYQSLTAGKVDSMTPELAYVGAEWDVKAAADRLLIHVSGNSCPFSKIRVFTKYSNTALTWQPLSAELKFLEEPRFGSASLLLPAFYRSTQHFQGIVVPKEYADCSISIERILGESRLPIVLTANIEDKTILGPMNKSIGDFDIKINEATITSSAVSGP